MDVMAVKPRHQCGRDVWHAAQPLHWAVMLQNPWYWFGAANAQQALIFFLNLAKFTKLNFYM